MSIFYSEKLGNRIYMGGISSVFGPPYPTRCDFRKCWYIQFDIEHWKSHFFGQKLEESVTFGKCLKLITLTAMSVTSIKHWGWVLYARAYRYSEQWEEVTWGNSFFTSATNPLLTPSISGAPSVQICLKLCRPSSLATKARVHDIFTFTAVCGVCRVMQNKNWFFIFLSCS